MLHELFQEIIRNALPAQIEREKKIVKPRQWHPEMYIEYHENREELQYCVDDYKGGKY